MEITDLSKGGVEWQLTKLKDKGVLTRKGSKKTGSWIVNKTVE